MIRVCSFSFCKIRPIRKKTTAIKYNQSYGECYYITYNYYFYHRLQAPPYTEERVWYTLTAYVPVFTQNLGTSYMYIPVKYSIKCQFTITSPFQIILMFGQQEHEANGKSSFKQLTGKRHRSMVSYSTCTWAILWKITDNLAHVQSVCTRAFLQRRKGPWNKANTCSNTFIHVAGLLHQEVGQMLRLYSTITVSGQSRKAAKEFIVEIDRVTSTITTYASID